MVLSGYRFLALVDDGEGFFPSSWMRPLVRYAKNVLETLGNTPLVRLNKVTAGLKPLILAKLAQFNPGGSVKDRIGVAKIEDAERKGRTDRRGTIVRLIGGCGVLSSGYCPEGV